MVVGAAEEAEAVGQDFQRALAEHQAVELHPLLEDAEDQVLLLEAGDFGEVLLAGLLRSAAACVIRCSSAMWVSPCLLSSFERLRPLFRDRRGRSARPTPRPATAARLRIRSAAGSPNARDPFRWRSTGRSVRRRRPIRCPMARGRNLAGRRLACALSSAIAKVFERSHQTYSFRSVRMALVRERRRRWEETK